MILSEAISGPKSPGLSTLVQPFVIAEAGVNHENDLALAKRMIDEAAEGGADCIKFQTYRAETLAVRNSPAYWDLTEEPTNTQFDLFKKHDKFWKNEFEALRMHCDSAGIEFLSTPFDRESAIFLNDLVSAFKIASADITNKPLIKQVCSFGKPIALSVGASNTFEIKRAVSWLKEDGLDVALLHCVLNYPTAEQDAQLARIVALREAFTDLVIGYSDHTLPDDMMPLEIAWLLGARILEKHFTFDKSLPGNDHYHAMDKDDLKVFRSNVARAIALQGTASLETNPSEQIARDNARRSLVIVRDTPAGTTIKEDMLIPKRPGTGISPADIDIVVGHTTKTDIAADTVLTWDMLTETGAKA